MATIQLIDLAGYFAFAKYGMQNILSGYTVKLKKKKVFPGKSSDDAFLCVKSVEKLMPLYFCNRLMDHRLSV